MDSTDDLGSRSMYGRPLSITPTPYIYVIGVLTSGQLWVGRYLAEGKGHTSKIGNSSRIPNLASEICALCHIFRDIDVISAFSEVAHLGATLRKAPKISI